MTLREAYRIALARGLTAKQAGAEFGLNHESIAKMKSRYGFPSLVREYDSECIKELEKMDDKDLVQYINVLERNKMTDKSEYKLAKEELLVRKSVT